MYDMAPSCAKRHHQAHHYKGDKRQRHAKITAFATSRETSFCGEVRKTTAMVYSVAAARWTRLLGVWKHTLQSE